MCPATYSCVATDPPKKSINNFILTVNVFLIANCAVLRLRSPAVNGLACGEYDYVHFILCGHYQGPLGEKLLATKSA